MYFKYKIQNTKKKISINNFFRLLFVAGLFSTQALVAGCKYLEFFFSFLMFIIIYKLIYSSSNTKMLYIFKYYL